MSGLAYEFPKLGAKCITTGLLLYKSAIATHALALDTPATSGAECFDRQSISDTHQADN